MNNSHIECLWALLAPYTQTKPARKESNVPIIKRPYCPNIYIVPRIFFHFSWILVADDSVSCFPLTSFRRSSVRSWCNCKKNVLKRFVSKRNHTLSIVKNHLKVSKNSNEKTEKVKFPAFLCRAFAVPQ